MLKSIRSFKGDLSTITAPPFLLSPVSLTEYPMHWAESPSLLVAAASQTDPAQRALAVTKWYISTLRPQFGKREGRKKKPLNPFLGELFLGSFQDKCGKTDLTVEQVSHHPPVTAYYIENKEHGVSLEGYHLQRTYFSGTLRIDRTGVVMLRLATYNEYYLITLPSMRLEGLLPPPPYPELDHETYVVSSTGYIAKTDYSGKGWLRGKKNSLHTRLYHENKPQDILFSVEGQWQGGHLATKSGKGDEVERLDTSGDLDITPLTVTPIDHQGPLESRKAWRKVAEAIEKGDMAAVGREKNKLEEEQRALRKTEAAEGREFQLRHFKNGEWDEAERLLSKIGKTTQQRDTKGVWRYSPAS